MSSKIQKIGFWTFVVISFSLWLYRITLHADVADEITNLTISYRISLGAIPFYHLEESFQAGDIFLVPFLWLFVKLTGGTTGIVLYSRVVYIGVLLVVALLTYKMLARYLEKSTAFLISYVIAFFEIYSLFYLWYDTAAIIFFLLGDLAIVNALENSKSRKQMYLFLALAGLCHTCMVIAHVALAPMAVGIGVLVAVLVYRYYEKKILSGVKCMLAYASLPLTALIIILPIAHVIMGLDNLFAMVLELLNSRGEIDFNMIKLAKDIVTTYFTVNEYFLSISIVLLVLYILVWIQPKLYVFLAMGIVILPIYNQAAMGNSIDRGLPNYLSYITLWAPYLYGLIRKKDKLDRCLLYVFCVPILFSAVLIPMLSITGSRGPIKSWQMCLPGAIAALYYLIKVWKERYAGDRRETRNLLLMVVSITLVYNAYTYNFLDEPLIQPSDNRITKGIYWGIKVNPNMECMEDIQELVEMYTRGAETIAASTTIRSIYLMTDAMPYARSTEMLTYWGGECYKWDHQLAYYERFGELPDALFLESYDLGDAQMWEVIGEYYQEMIIAKIGDYKITVYRKKDSDISGRSEVDESSFISRRLWHANQ